MEAIYSPKNSVDFTGLHVVTCQKTDFTFCLMNFTVMFLLISMNRNPNRFLSNRYQHKSACVKTNQELIDPLRAVRFG
jgi:hypothetical protein